MERSLETRVDELERLLDQVFFVVSGLTVLRFRDGHELRDSAHWRAAQRRFREAMAGHDASADDRETRKEVLASIDELMTASGWKRDLIDEVEEPSNHVELQVSIGLEPPATAEDARAVVELALRRAFEGDLVVEISDRAPEFKTPT